MPLTVTHTASADASFAALGKSAWNGTHTVTGTVTGSMLESAWPIGSVFTSVVTTNPNTLLGFGTWAALGVGQVLVGVNTAVTAFNTVRSTGGALTSLVTVTGSNAISLTKDPVAGTNAISLFREAVAGSNAASAASGSVSVAWPTGVPIFAGATGSASASVDWPAGKPVFTGVVHRHELPIIHTSAAVVMMLPTSTFGVGAVSRVEDHTEAIGLSETTGSGVCMLSNTATASGTISFPASVPQARVTGLVAAGVISWPATAPSATWVSGTAAAQIFSGLTGSVSGQAFTGVTASVSGQIFTGVTGTVSVIQPFFCVYFWERTA